MTVSAPSPSPSPPTPPVSGRNELWVKPMSDGARVAVILLNLDDNHHFDLTLAWSQINISNSTELSVRDLWDLENAVVTSTNEYTAKAVPPHGVAMLMLERIK